MVYIWQTLIFIIIFFKLSNKDSIIITDNTYY